MSMGKLYIYVNGRFDFSMTNDSFVGGVNTVNNPNPSPIIRLSITLARISLIFGPYGKTRLLSHLFDIQNSYHSLFLLY